MIETEPPLLMLVDDEPAQRRLTTALTARAGWRATCVNTGEEALAMLGTREGMRLGAVLIDDWSQKLETATLIREIRTRRPQLPVIVLTAHGGIALAIEAMRAGAVDFIAKPIAPESLMAALQALASHPRGAGEMHPMSEKFPAQLDFDEIVGSSPTFRAALAIAAKAARTRVPILIDGEPGVGKDMIARAIRAASARGRLPFVSVNCAAVPANLIESELFGHERGAFAGAFDRHLGKIVGANHGTVLLDEINALPADAQAKLVRVIESGEVVPLGGRGATQVDVRVIAATNIRLLDEVEAGRFREDLYYKLNIVQISLPPLRERLADLPALARHLLARSAAQPGLKSLGITSEALALLQRHTWPGNVRQLQTVLFRAAVKCEGDALTEQDFPQLASIVANGGGGANGLAGAARKSAQEEGIGVTLYEANGHLRALADIEADVIRLAIGHYRGRMTEVARRLGIGRSTLYRKLAELGIDTAA